METLNKNYGYRNPSGKNVYASTDSFNDAGSFIANGYETSGTLFKPDFKSNYVRGNNTQDGELNDERANQSLQRMRNSINDYNQNGYRMPNGKYKKLK